jgi:CRISPR-associated protein Csd2
MKPNSANVVGVRHDFVYLFDCQDGNPNGDPDADNAPRIDAETSQGLVSDVCLKRQIRDYVRFRTSSNGLQEPGYDIFIRSGLSLENRQRIPYDTLKLDPKHKDHDRIAQARAWMCQNFYDVRAFGAVMSTTEFNCGQVRGPVQITFARSLDRIVTTEHCITRVSYTREEKARGTTANTEIGRKYTITYGLYRAHGFINAVFAEQTGFTEADLELLWEALANMFDTARSASRGMMSTRGLYVFRHSSALGRAPAHTLFDSISVARRKGVESPRSFSDYIIDVNDSALPSGVELIPVTRPELAIAD